jgi:HEAT repeat protein
LGDPRAVEVLVAALREDRDWVVRSSAARALGALGDRRAFEPLVGALREDSDSDVRSDAAKALGAFLDRPEFFAAPARS